MLTDPQSPTHGLNPMTSMHPTPRPRRHAGIPRALRALLPLACLLVAMTGCGDRGNFLDTRPAHGTATFQGKPMEHAVITLYPVSGEPKKRHVLPHGEVGPDGAFQLWTYKVGDGVPPGEYQVTVTWPNRPSSDIGMPGYVGDQLKGRFATVDKSQLRFTIEKGDNALPPIELQ